jgi:uncharacterized membrane protein YeaQ/YmgE (transglycosylase-associated protein family)
MSFVSALDFFAGVDAIICLAVGVFAGWLAGPFMRGGGYGLIGNIVIGAVGAVVSGLLFDWLNVMDIGDYLDPLIAGALGAAILLAVAGVLRLTSTASRA